MGIAGNWLTKSITSPRGQWSVLQERRMGNPSRASVCQNMRFAPGVAKTRPGTATLYSTAGTVRGIYNWIAPSGRNWVSYRQGSNIEALLQGVGIKTLLTGIGNTLNPVFSELDVWQYFCGYDANGLGTIQTRIMDDAVPTPNVDKAFAPPIAFTSSTGTVENGNYLPTVGIHYFGFVYQNRTGFSGRPTTEVKYAISATTNGTPDTLTAPGNTLVDGTVVTITGSMGDTGINGDRIVADVGISGSGTFRIKDTVTGAYVNGNGAYTGGGVVEQPVVVETTADGQRFVITVTLPARTDGGVGANGANANLALIATTTTNPNKWFYVPPATGNSTSIVNQDVPYNTPTTLTFIFDCDDPTLEQGDSAANQFFVFSQAADGTGPFNPNFVVAYGQRMCYGVGTVMYASDINQPQQIAPDRNAVTMPNQRYIGAAWTLPNGTDMFLSGATWTGRVTDNSDIPATWSEPVSVSNSLGAAFMNCVCPKTRGGWVWIATESGIYLFNGLYAEKPITWLINDVWVGNQPPRATDPPKVNWAAANIISMADNIKEMRLYVAVALGSATEATHTIVIDYQNCADAPVFDQVEITIDKFNRASFGGVGLVVEEPTKLTNCWIGPPTGGGAIVKYFDGYVNDADNLVPIDWFWETGLIRTAGELKTAMMRVGAVDLWLHGNSDNAGGYDANGNWVDGDLAVTVYSPDRQQSISPALCIVKNTPARLTQDPGVTYQTADFSMSNIENCTIRIGSNKLNCWAEISALMPYYKHDLSNR